jgi:thiamine transport system substrate-binding protein
MTPSTTPAATRRRSHRRAALALVAVALVAASAAACSDSGSDSAKGADGKPTVTIRLLAHDSFAVSDGVLAAFTKETGIKVEVVQGGDAGTVVNQAILTKGAPQGDVLYGVDSTFLTRALDEDLFEPYEPSALDGVDASLLLDAKARVTPIDYGDVCLNYDKAWFASHDVPVPSTLEDLTKPAYKDLLVAENPATSSTGLAFLLATVEHFGDDGWQVYWRALKANGVQVENGWEEAYNSVFSGGGESTGTRPLVVSYASSPAAEVVYADPPVDEAPTGVIQAGCYRQVEGAGVLRGTKHAKEAGQLIDFMLSKRFQADMPLSMFVYPVRSDVALPPAFTSYAVAPGVVVALDAADIDAHRDAWINEWTDLVGR